MQNSLKQTLLRGHAKTSIETPKIPAVLNYGLGLKQNLGLAHKSTVNFDIPFAFKPCAKQTFKRMLYSLSYIRIILEIPVIGCPNPPLQMQSNLISQMTENGATHLV